MRIGTRSEGHAKCFIGICKVLPKKIRYSVREVSQVFVSPDHRGNGDASRLLKKVCEEASKENMVVIVIPKAYSKWPSMTDKQLEEWYVRSFGFAAIQHDPLILAKAPMKYFDKFKLKVGEFHE